MSKFKVGDKVQVVAPILTCQKKYIGNIFTIHSINEYDDISVEENDNIWKPVELQLIQSNKLRGDVEMSDVLEIYKDKKQNKVLDLYYSRKVKEIKDKYNKLKEEFIQEEFDIINSLNNLQDSFMNNFDMFYELDKQNDISVINRKIDIDLCSLINYHKIDEVFLERYQDDKEREFKELNELYEEVKAQLSLSDDLKYQQEVLERYGIINKKTKKLNV